MSFPRFLTAERAAGLVILLFGVWFVREALGLREGPGYAAIGPKTFPIIVGIGFLVAGLGVLARRDISSPPAPKDNPAEAVVAVHDWRTLGAFGLLLVVYIGLFLPLGFILSSTLLMVIGAWLLGSTSWKRDLIVGLGVGIASYLVFVTLLGLELPAGPLEVILRPLRPGAAFG